MRAVLGSSPGQLVRLFVTESALLCAVGAAAGIGLSALALRALIAAGPRMPGLTVASLDERAVLFAVALAVIAGLVVGGYPAVLLSRKGHVGLSTGARAIGGGRGTRAIRSGFVIAQFALALPLLAISGLLLVSFVRLQRVDVGFDPGNLLTVRVSLPAGQYRDSTARGAYWARALPRVREVAGVRDVGLATIMPPDDFGNSNDNFNLLDRPAAPGMPEPNGTWPSVTPEYFTTLGVRLLDGRSFTPADTGPPAVVLVSRSWAQKYYPGESVLGKKMVRGGCTECPLTTIVGVVDDVRYDGLTGPLDALYSPLSENWMPTVYVYARTAGSPNELIAPVREALRSVDPSVPLDDIASMEDRLYTSVAEPRQWATLLGDVRGGGARSGRGRRLRHAVVHGEHAPARDRRANGARRAAAHDRADGRRQRARTRDRRVGARSPRGAHCHAHADDLAPRRERDRPRHAHPRDTGLTCRGGGRLLASRAPRGRYRSARGHSVRIAAMNRWFPVSRPL